MTSPYFSQIRSVFIRHGWFYRDGAYVLVDGQFGSTGKGALAALIGAALGDRIDIVTTNAGPNSGHTGYLPENVGRRKILTRQIPVASVVTKVLDLNPDQITYLNSGAILDPGIVDEERREYGLNPIVHPHAAMIAPYDKKTEESGSTAKIASTAKGVGSALARKIMRDPMAVVNPDYEHGVADRTRLDRAIFVETAQGFSLGVNSGFYPYTTSRECTVMQALADARIPAQLLRKVIMSVRTYPIRVGNTEAGWSGPGYPDQEEIQWEDIGVEPELTTVTKRVRRLFTWSRLQFMEAVRINRPDVVFLNFCQYLPKEKYEAFIFDMVDAYRTVMGGRLPDFILTGWGPYPEDVEVVT